MRRAAIALAALAFAGAAVAQAPQIPLEALKAAGLDPETQVADGRLQLMTGQRAVIGLDEAGQPQLAQVEETYKGTGAGRLAFALDASVEKRQSILKVWNGLTRPLAYEAEITALRGGKLMKKASTICAVPAGAVGYEVWPDPVISVTLSKFAETPADQHVCQ